MIGFKKRLLAVIAAPLIFIGCGSSTGGITGGASNNGATNDGEVVATALLGGDAETTGDNMNAAIAENLSQKVEEQLNLMLENGDINMDQIETEYSASKAINGGFNLKRGFFLDIVDEAIPFAGGQMILNGTVNLSLKYMGGSKLGLVATGDLTSKLQDVQKTGYVAELPYTLALNGTTDLGLTGTFSVTIKWFKVTSMSADIKAAVESSDVIAHGDIDGRAVDATVDLVNLSIGIANADILHAPKAFVVSCTGDMSFKVNDNEIAACKMASACNKCE